jgi:hypothetical protein
MIALWFAFKGWLKWKRWQRARELVKPTEPKPEFPMAARAFCISCGGYGCPHCSHGAVVG